MCMQLATGACTINQLHVHVIFASCAVVSNELHKALCLYCIFKEIVKSLIDSYQLKFILNSRDVCKAKETFSMGMLYVNSKQLHVHVHVVFAS